MELFLGKVAVQEEEPATTAVDIFASSEFNSVYVCDLSEREG